MTHEDDYNKTPPDAPNLGVIDFEICGVVEIILPRVDSGLFVDDREAIQAVNVFVRAVKTHITDGAVNGDFTIDGDYEIGLMNTVSDAHLWLWGGDDMYRGVSGLIRTYSRELYDSRIMDRAEEEALGEATAYLINQMGEE